MKRVRLISLLAGIFFSFTSLTSSAQTYTITHDITWETTNQNMWGPNGTPFNINTTINLFQVAYDTIMQFGFMDTTLGISNGALFTLDTWFEIGSTFEMTGWTTGWVDVTYPVSIDLTFPNDYTFNPGETVTINSEYEVLPGWELYSHFPQAGVISLDLDFGLGLNFDATVCVVGVCNTFPIIDVNVPTDSIIIFYLNGQTGQTIYPCYDPSSPFGFSFCSDTILPITFNNLFGIGLSGAITLPYIETTDWLDTNDPCHQFLAASGDSTYMDLDLDIIQFLSAIAGLIPPPQGPAIQQFLGMLNGTIDIGMGVIVDYSLLTANLSITNTMQQDLTFDPTIRTIFTFPTPVEYFVSDPNNGNAIVDQGVSDSISFATCHDFNYKYPCFGWPQMPIGIAHHLDNDFTNHTWDSIAFTFLLTALEFTITVPFPYVKAVEIPEFCLEIPYDSVLTYTICSPQIENEAWSAQKQIQEIPGGGGTPPEIMWTYHIGPLVNLSIPLGYIPLTWYNNTWELAGFSHVDTTFPGEIMIPNPEMLMVGITGTNNVCSGDSIGSITVTVQYGTLPYIYYWSHGVIDTSFATSNTQTGLLSGTYTVTVSDINGCTLVEQFTVVESNPPIFITLTANHVLCHGDNTGSVVSTVTGGTPPYTYAWSPIGGAGPNATSLPAGTYTLSVVDDVGCPMTATTTVTEPATVVDITLDSLEHILCWGGDNGSSLEDIDGLEAGTYTVTVTDSHGCTETLTETLTEPTMLSCAILGTNVSCYGFGDGEADLVVGGGTPPYTYLWSTGAVTEDLTMLQPGTYEVTVTDDNGCTDVATTTITQPIAPLSATWELTHVLCHGDFTGAINLIPTGGTAPYAYSWSSGQTTQDLNSIPAGNYDVTITDFNLCTFTGSMTIIEPAAPLVATIVGTDVRCHGEVNGAADLSVTGGTPPYDYNWNNGSSNQDIDQLLAGLYQVTVTDDHACTTVASVVIIEPDVLYASVDLPQTICMGQSADILCSTTGGTAWYVYQWNNGMTDSIITVNPLVTTQYSVTVTDSHGCITSDFTQIVVHTAVFADFDLVPDTICPGDPVVITADISGGNGHYYILLNDTVNIQVPYTYYPVASQQIHLTAGDDCGSPVSNATKDIVVLSAPPVSFTPDVTEGCEPLTVNFNESSIHQGQLYSWDFGDPSSSNFSDLKNPSHEYDDAGIYDVSLTVTSPGGCVSHQTAAALIHVYPLPEALFTTYPLTVTIVNPEVSFINLSSNATNYWWYFGDNDSSYVVSPVHTYPAIPNSYNITLIALNPYGCVDTVRGTLMVKGDYTFYAPTGFTPDADNLNEFFHVQATGIDFSTFRMQIYDRWGEIIFESNDIMKGWDGYAKDSSPVPVGTYTWFVTFKDGNGISHIESGPVTVIH
jgi:gliding motility-associated-like protein